MISSGVHKRNKKIYTHTHSKYVSNWARSSALIIDLYSLAPSLDFNNNRFNIYYILISYLLHVLELLTFSILVYRIFFMHQ